MGPGNNFRCRGCRTTSECLQTFGEQERPIVGTDPRGLRRLRCAHRLRDEKTVEAHADGAYLLSGRLRPVVIACPLLMIDWWEEHRALIEDHFIVR